MSSHPSTSLTFYNAYCFNSSPTYHEWARLTAADVHALKEREGFQGQTPSVYFHLNHPIRYVRLVGVVVAFDVYEYRYIMVLDDSSGENIEVTCGRVTEESNDAKSETQKATKGKMNAAIGKTQLNNTVNMTGVDVGSVVKIKGCIGSFRGMKQIQLERLWFVRTTNEEAKAWAENTAFRRDVLSKPWVLTEKEVRKARLKAEGYEARKKAKEERKRQKEALERERQRREGRRTKEGPRSDHRSRKRRPPLPSRIDGAGN